MKYFTAELYEQFNSRDVDAANAADSLWDQAAARYKDRLGEIRQSLPPQVKALANRLCLHDAELVNLAVSATDALILAREQNTLYMLTYRLTAPAVIGAPRTSSPFSEHGVRWLYDEVDATQPGEFSHRILLSNGQEIGLVFDDIRVQQCEVHPLGTSRILALADRMLAEGQELAKTILAPRAKEARSGLVAKAKELRLTIRDAKKRGLPTSGELPSFSTGTKPGKVALVAVYRLGPPARRKPRARPPGATPGESRRKAKRRGALAPTASGWHSSSRPRRRPRARMRN